MKTIITIMLAFIVSASSCQIENEQNRLNCYLKSVKKPVIVRTIKYGSEMKPNVTLISKDNKILYLEYTSICLPDTIK